MTSNFFTAGEVQAARQQKLKGVQNAQSWGCFFGMLGMLMQFSWFCWISFWIPFGWMWMIIGAGVDFFWWSTPWFRVKVKGSQYLQNWVVLVLWVAFLFTFFVEENKCFKAFAMADDDHDDEELHWTSLNTDWCGSRGTLQPCWRQEHRKKELEKKARSRSAPWKEFRFEDVMFSSQMQGKECRSSWFGAPIYMDGTVLMAAIRDNRWGDNFS